MDIVVIFNGLGNQMSQYAFYQSKLKREGSVTALFDRRSLRTHDGYVLEKAFGIRLQDNIKSNILCFILRLLDAKKYPAITRPLVFALNFFGFSLVRENPNYDYNEDLLKNKKSGVRFLYGGWHSEKYFIKDKKTLQYLFRPNLPKSSSFQTLVSNIRNTNSVSLHVRRGDYMKDENYEMWGRVCDTDYFLRAISYLNQKLESPTYFVFSNDIEWVKENIRIDQIVIVENYNDHSSWSDLYLMSKCKHHINSNSTFSWWAAWLSGESGSITIRPEEFISNLPTKDIYPENWKKL